MGKVIAWKERNMSKLVEIKNITSMNVLIYPTNIDMSVALLSTEGTVVSKKTCFLSWTLHFYNEM